MPVNLPVLNFVNCLLASNILAATSINEEFTSEDWKSFTEVKKEEVLSHYRLAYLADTLVNWCPALGTVLANDEVPPPVMNLTVFMSVLLLIGFIILGVQDFWVHIFMIVSMATTVQFIINLLVDLNNPFKGVWNISKNHYLDLEQQIENQIIK